MKAKTINKTFTIICNTRSNNSSQRTQQLNLNQKSETPLKRLKIVELHKDKMLIWWR